MCLRRRTEEPNEAATMASTMMMPDSPAQPGRLGACASEWIDVKSVGHQNSGILAGIYATEVW